jgi:hypothetical protein
VNKHLEGKKNPVDGPSRSPDHVIGHERPTARLLATLPITTIQPYNNPLNDIKPATVIDALVADVKRLIVATPLANIPQLERIADLEEASSNECKVTSRVFT